MSLLRLAELAVIAGQSAAPWTPSTDGNLLQWIDFSDSSKLFNSISGGSTPGSGANILRAEDKSGNGWHGTTESPANGMTGPTRVLAAQNGLDVARFSGTLQWLKHSLNITGDSTVLISCKSAQIAPEAGMGARVMYQACSAGSDLKVYIRDITNPTPPNNQWSTYRSSDLHSGYALSSFSTISLETTSTQSKLTTNGNLASFTDSAFYNDPTNDRRLIGAGYHSWSGSAWTSSSECFAGDIGEILVFGPGFSNLAAATLYLKTKWGTP